MLHVCAATALRISRLRNGPLLPGLLLVLALQVALPCQSSSAPQATREGPGPSSWAADPAKLGEFRYLWNLPWLWRSFDQKQFGFGGPFYNLLEDGEGRIWASGTGGIAYYDGFEWNPIRIPGGFSLSTPVPFFRNHDGRALALRGERLWVASDSSLEEFELPGDEVAEIAGVFAAGKTLYLLSIPGGRRVNQHSRARLFAWNAAGLAAVPWPFPEAESRGPRFAAAGEHLFASNYEETRVLHEGRWERFAAGHLVSLAQGPDGRGVAVLRGAERQYETWSCERERLVALLAKMPRSAYGVRVRHLGGVFVLIRQNGEFLLWAGSGWERQQNQSVQLDELREAIQDRHGHIWLAGRREILVRLDHPPRWRRWQHALSGDSKALKPNSCFEILRSSRGELWMGMREGVERRSPDGTLLARYTTADHPDLRFIKGLCETESGSILATSSKSGSPFVEFDGSRWRTIPASPDLGLQSSRALVSDPSGRPVLGGLRAGEAGDCLYRYENGSFVPIGCALGLEESQIASVAFAPDGTLWAGGTHGLHRFRDGRWESWQADQSRAGRVVWAVEPIDGERCWIANYAFGLGRYDPEQGLRFLQGDDRSPATLSTALAADRQGRLWIGTETGLVLREADKLWIEHLTSRKSSRNPRALLALEDRLVVGAIDGFSWVLDLRAPALEDLVRLTHLHVHREGSTLLARWELRAPWASPPVQSMQTRFRVDAGSWSSWSLDRQVAIAELSGGSHRFELELLDPLSGAVFPIVDRVVEGFPRPLHLRLEFLLPVIGSLVLILTALGWSLVQRRRGELRANEEREYSQLLLENSKEGIFSVNPDGTIRGWNSSMELLFGLSRDAMLGKDAITAFPFGRRMHEALGDSSPFGGRSDPPDSYPHLILEDPDGNSQLECVLSTGRNPDGQLLGTICVLRDATERLRRESRLRTSQKLEAVGTLASGLAHDVNNSLQSILGYADLARDADQDRDACLDRLVAAAERTQGITRTLLGFARPSRNAHVPIEFAAFVRETGQVITSLLSKRFELDVSAEPGLWVEGDPSALQQLLINLVLNARDAMPGGGLIEIHARSDGDHVSLLVRDQGCGIPKGAQERILDPFFTTKPRGKGTGLGLSVVHWVLEEHDGSLEIDSEPGEGAEFRCTLNRVPAPVTESAPHASPPEDIDGAGSLVLIVEDDAQIRDLVRDHLVAHGFECICCESGTEALARMEDFASSLALAILDYDLPGANGLEVLVHLRAANESLPAILMSGLMEVHLTSPELDRLSRLSKPFRRTQLLEKVAAALAS